MLHLFKQKLGDDLKNKGFNKSKQSKVVSHLGSDTKDERMRKKSCYFTSLKKPHLAKEKNSITRVIAKQLERIHISLIRVSEFQISKVMKVITMPRHM